MNMRPRKYVFISALVVILVAILVGAAVKKRTHQETEQEQRVTATNLPLISSSAAQVVVLSAVVYQDILNITVVNDSPKGIQALAVSSGDYGIILDNGLISDNPETIIKPRGNYVIEIPVDNLKPTIPVIISGVIYDDDTNGGKAEVVEEIREERSEQRAKRLSQPQPKVGVH